MNIKVSQGDILLPVDDYAIALLQKFGSNSQLNETQRQVFTPYLENNRTIT